MPCGGRGSDACGKMEFDQTMRKKAFLISICLILALTTLVCSAACLNIFGNKTDTSKYYIDVANVEDSRAASIVYNNTHSSCVRIISDFENGSTAASSGFIITSNGYVLTNRHCVLRYKLSNTDTPASLLDKPLKVSYYVVFMDDTQYKARLVAYSETADIAILKIDTGISSYSFEALTFETERKLYYGDRLYTIGNPENLGLILTELMVASPAVKLKHDDAFDSIVLDGNINHGNSGGALINVYSRVCGIIFARVESSSTSMVYGIGCAIPTSTILSFLDKNNIIYKTTPTNQQ